MEGEDIHPRADVFKTASCLENGMTIAFQVYQTAVEDLVHPGKTVPAIASAI